MEAIVGTEKRLGTVAKDLVHHFEERLEAMDGKAMVVCMSRRICVDLYNEIVKLRPDWHNENDDAGVLKIVMTGSATDGPEWQQHIRDKRRREALGKRFKDAKDPFKIVIVRDMWLTGFDVPSLHTMYVDKPMRGHGLMQAIARVNRVFKDKPGGLVVDYLGIAHELKLALAYVHRERRQGADGIATGRSGRRDAGEVRDMPWSVPRVRLVAVDHGNPSAEAWASTERTRAHPEAGGRKGPAGQGCHRSLEGVRTRSATRRSDTNSG